MIKRPSQAIIDAIEDGTVTITRRIAFFERNGETPWYPEGLGEEQTRGRLLSTGGVTIDYSRDERRTLDIELDNSDKKLNLNPDGFWYDKVIKLWRGLSAGPIVEEWQLGEFLIDNIDDEHFPNKLKVVGRDQTKKMLQSKLRHSASWEAGVKLDVLVKALAANSGVSKTDKIVGNFPTLGKKLDVERGNSRWAIAKDAANAKGYDLYFDAEGYLRLEKFPDPAAGAVEWVFKTGTDGGNLVEYKRSVNDSDMYNVVIVQSPAPDSGIPFYWVAKNIEPSSPTSIANIGERVMDVITLDSADSEDDCKQYARATLKVAGLENYTVNFSSIYYPWFDAGVVVQLLEEDRQETDPTRFLLTNLNMPVELGPMGGDAKRVTIVGDVDEYDEEQPPPVEIPTDPDDEEPETPPDTTPEPPDNVNGKTETLWLATFNLHDGNRTESVAKALDRIADAGADLMGIQEGNNAKDGLNRFLRNHPGWGIWRGDNNSKQACCILYRKSIGTVTGKKFNFAMPASHFGPVGRPVGTYAKHVAELQIKLKESQRKITLLNMHTIAGFTRSLAYMGNPEWQRRQNHINKHMQVLVDRIDAIGSSSLIFSTGDFNMEWGHAKNTGHRNRMTIDHNYDTHGPANNRHRIDFVTHKDHAAIAVVDTKKIPMNYPGVSDHDAVLVKYRIRGA